MDGWMEVKASLRTAYSNKSKLCCINKATTRKKKINFKNRSMHTQKTKDLRKDKRKKERRKERTKEGKKEKQKESKKES